MKVKSLSFGWLVGMDDAGSILSRKTGLFPRALNLAHRYRNLQVNMGSTQTSLEMDQKAFWRQ